MAKALSQPDGFASRLVGLTRHAGRGPILASMLIALTLGLALSAAWIWVGVAMAKRGFARDAARLAQELSANPREGEVVMGGPARCSVRRRQNRENAMVALTTKRIVWSRGRAREELPVDHILDVRDASHPATPMARMVVTTRDLRETTFEITMPKPDLAGWIAAIGQGPK